MIQFINDCIAAARKKHAERLDAAERAAIAQAFNDRYTYRTRWSGAPDAIKQHAWMCPDCNKVHLTTEFSIWVGVMYPACCSHSAGHRLYAGIRTR